MANKKNVAIIQQAFTDFGNRDIDDILKICSADVSWASYENPLVPFAGTFKGREGVKDFLIKVADTVEYTSFVPKVFMSDEVSVTVLGNHSGKVRKTGKQFDHSWCMVFKLEEGQVNWFFVFVDSYQIAEAFRD